MPKNERNRRCGVTASIERRNATQHRNVQQRNRNATVTQQRNAEQEWQESIEDGATPAPTDGEIVPVVDLYGAGQVQRRVWRAFVANPDVEFTTAELARWAYPRLTEQPSRKHRWAIVRAAQRVAARVRRDRPGGVVFRARAETISARTDENTPEIGR